MTILYILLIVLCFYCEISEGVNTENILHKISLAFVIVGSLICLAEKPNHLIEIGLLGHIGYNVYRIVRRT